MPHAFARGKSPGDLFVLQWRLNRDRSRDRGSRMRTNQGLFEEQETARVPPNLTSRISALGTMASERRQ